MYNLLIYSSRGKSVDYKLCQIVGTVHARTVEFLLADPEITLK